MAKVNYCTLRKLYQLHLSSNYSGPRGRHENSESCQNVNHLSDNWVNVGWLIVSDLFCELKELMGKLNESAQNVACYKNAPKRN